MPIDILDRDGRIVDENTDRERKSAQGHDVERLAKRGEGRDRAKDRKWNRRRDDDRRTPASEKDEDHDAREGGSYDALDNDAVHRPAYEHRLIADLRYLERGRQGRLDLLQLFLDA